MKPSKPFGMSKIKNHSRHYEPSGETPKHLENFMSDDRAESEVAMEQALKAVAPEKLSSVRKAYGIPSAEGVKTDDREALLQLYRIEASRLKELLK
jgi:hypothetical protein